MFSGNIWGMRMNESPEDVEKWLPDQGSSTTEIWGQIILAVGIVPWTVGFGQHPWPHTLDASSLSPCPPGWQQKCLSYGQESLVGRGEKGGRVTPVVNHLSRQRVSSRALRWHQDGISRDRRRWEVGEEDDVRGGRERCRAYARSPL